MKYEEIINQLSNRHHGTSIRIVYKSDVPVAAAHKKAGYTVEKITDAVVRFGCSYGNLKAVKLRRAENPEPSTPQRPLWFRWVDGHEKIIKEHNTNGARYLNVQPIPGSRNTSSYYVIKLNGQTLNGHATKEDVQNSGLVLGSYWNKQSQLDTFDINIENVIEIKPKKH